jgi:hypothetical protein
MVRGRQYVGLLRADESLSLNFRGVVCPIEQVSAASPTGARGRRIVISRGCAEQSMRALVGAPLTWSRSASHKRAECIGEIRFVTCEQGVVEIVGALESCPRFTGDLGLSFEVSGATIECASAKHWRITSGEFRAVMVGPQSRVAFRDATSFEVIG